MSLLKRSQSLSWIVLLGATALCRGHSSRRHRKRSALGAGDLVELRGVEIDWRRGSWRSRRWIERSLAEREGRSNDLGHFHRVTVATDMHVESLRIGAQQMVVDRRDLDATLEQLGHD